MQAAQLTIDLLYIVLNAVSEWPLIRGTMYDQ
jgi:hypothetical protein